MMRKKKKKHQENVKNHKTCSLREAGRENDSEMKDGMVATKKKERKKRRFATIKVHQRIRVSRVGVMGVIGTTREKSVNKITYEEGIQ